MKSKGRSHTSIGTLAISTLIWNYGEIRRRCLVLCENWKPEELFGSGILMRDKEVTGMNRVFEMRLRPDPFSRICSGEKTIEFRLHDEKRSLLRKGDYIRFTEIVDAPVAKEVLVCIEDIITAPSFVVLNEKLINMGFLPVNAFCPADMRKYYAVEDEAKYGVMGIRIKVVDNVG